MKAAVNGVINFSVYEVLEKEIIPLFFTRGARWYT
jgi:hypothetical protein